MSKSDEVSHGESRTYLELALEGWEDAVLLVLVMVEFTVVEEGRAEVELEPVDEARDEVGRAELVELTAVDEAGRAELVELIAVDEVGRAELVELTAVDEVGTELEVSLVEEEGSAELVELTAVETGRLVEVSVPFPPLLVVELRSVGAGRRPLDVAVAFPPSVDVELKSVEEGKRLVEVTLG